MNVVDNLASGQPGRTTAANQGPSSPAGGAGDDKQSRRDERIQQLAQERDRWKQQYAQLHEKIESLEERLQGFSGSQSSQGSEEGTTSPRGWGDLTEQQLEQVYLESDNEQTRLQALREMVDRKGRHFADQVVRQTDERRQTEAYRNNVFSNIVQTFGDRAQDRDSDLWQQANAQYAALEQRYGREKVEEMPELQELSFYKAAYHLSEPERQELTRLREQVRAYQAREGLSQQGSVQLDEVKDSLDKGDTGQAVAAVASRLFGDRMR